jgi:hypothetical protein
MVYGNPSGVPAPNLYDRDREAWRRGDFLTSFAMPVFKKPVQPVKYKPDPEVVAKQQQLIDAGFDIGKADGIWGKKSQAAWEEFQTKSQEKNEEITETVATPTEDTLPEETTINENGDVYQYRTQWVRGADGKYTPRKVPYAVQPGGKGKYFLLEDREPGAKKEYQDGGFIDLELTDNEIEEYRKGGYIVEELPKAQSGLASQFLERAKQAQQRDPERFAEETRKLQINKLLNPKLSTEELKEKLIRESEWRRKEERYKEGVESKKRLNKAAENYQEYYNKTYGSDYGELSIEDAYKKVSQPGFDVDKYVGMYNLGQPKNEQFVSNNQSTASRVWDVVTNPLTAFKYSVQTGDFRNMPSNINAARMAGQDVDPDNLVGNALNTTVNLFDAGDKVVRNVEEGNYGTAALEAMRFLPGARVNTGAGKYFKQGYNKVATGNSALPIAWKVEKTTNPIKSSDYIARNYTDAEIALLDKYGKGMTSLTPEEWEQMVKLTKSGAADFSKSNTPISRILDYYAYLPENQIIKNLKRGEVFKTPQEKNIRTWSAGVSNKTPDEQKTRLVIPSRYTKNLGDNFAAMPYTDKRSSFIWDPETGRLNAYAVAEKELMGNIPEGFKVIGKTKQDGFDNIIIKPLKPQQLPGSPNTTIAPTKMGPSFGMDMSKYEIKNPDYFTQLLNTYDSKTLSATNKKFYKDLINSVKKQNGLVTERQYNELQRLKTGNFNFGKKGYANGGNVSNYIERELNPKQIEWYKSQGYNVEELD